MFCYNNNMSSLDDASRVGSSTQPGARFDITGSQPAGMTIELGEVVGSALREEAHLDSERVQPVIRNQEALESDLQVCVGEDLNFWSTPLFPHLNEKMMRWRDNVLKDEDFSSFTRG